VLCELGTRALAVVSPLLLSPLLLSPCTAAVCCSAQQINSWVSEHLQNLTHVNEITAQISANFPDCIYRCCKSEQTLETSITLPSLSCSPGLKLNPITKICSGESASYAQCPSNMMKCPASLPSGQPICVSETDSFGLDTCKVLVLAHHTLPQHQCPS
jgi:hypothetical protein